MGKQQWHKEHPDSSQCHPIRLCECECGQISVCVCVCRDGDGRVAFFRGGEGASLAAMPGSSRGQAVCDGWTCVSQSALLLWASALPRRPALLSPPHAFVSPVGRRRPRKKELGENGGRLSEVSSPVDVRSASLLHLCFSNILTHTLFQSHTHTLTNIMMSSLPTPLSPPSSPSITLSIPLSARLRYRHTVMHICQWRNSFWLPIKTGEGSMSADVPIPRRA